MRIRRAPALTCREPRSTARCRRGKDEPKRGRLSVLPIRAATDHANDDDPIVFPGQPGKSHPHTFFGNTSTDADSTLASLLAGASTCKPHADCAGYWVPTLYQNGKEVRPAKGQFYYNLRGYDQMRAFPPGLKIVSGDSHAHHPQSTRIVYWDCGGAIGARTPPSATSLLPAA